jgi:hypothetical protein
MIRIAADCWYRRAAVAGSTATPIPLPTVHHAQLVVQQLERMRGELSEYAGGFRGRVRLFANTTASAEFLPAALAAFLSQHPQIDIDLEERSSRDIVRAVAGNLAEIGIVGDEVNPAKELQTFPFAEDRLVLIAPRDHVVSRQRSIAFRDALAYDHVGLPAGNALQDQVEDHAARAGHRLKLRVRLPGFDAVCQVEGCASRRCANATAMPFEKRRAEALFHQPNSFAGRCQRHTRPRGAMRDICGLDHKQEQTQIDQIKAHGSFHEELTPSALP